MAVTADLSDSHKIRGAELKKSFQEAKLREEIYENYNCFNETKFKNELNSTQGYNVVATYNDSESIFPSTNKILRGNHIHNIHIHPQPKHQDRQVIIKRFQI